jgi:hypothetical protein
MPMGALYPSEKCHFMTSDPDGATSESSELFGNFDTTIGIKVGEIRHTSSSNQHLPENCLGALPASDRSSSSRFL